MVHFLSIKWYKYVELIILGTISPESYFQEMSHYFGFNWKRCTFGNSFVDEIPVHACEGEKFIKGSYTWILYIYIRWTLIDKCIMSTYNIYDFRERKKKWKNWWMNLVMLTNKKWRRCEVQCLHNNTFMQYFPTVQWSPSLASTA